MTPEQRLDRVERILGLFAREGRRWRVLKREQDEKVNILIHFQMETTEKINQTTEQINRLASEQAIHYAIHSKEMADIRREQKLTQQSLRAFIDSLRKGNGKSLD